MKFLAILVIAFCTFVFVKIPADALGFTNHQADGLAGSATLLAGTIATVLLFPNRAVELKSATLQSCPCDRLAAPPDGYSVQRRVGVIQAIKYTGDNRADLVTFLVGRVKTVHVSLVDDANKLLLTIDDVKVNLVPGDYLVHTAANKLVAITGEQYATLFGPPAEPAVTADGMSVEEMIAAAVLAERTVNADACDACREWKGHELAELIRRRPTPGY